MTAFIVTRAALAAATALAGEQFTVPLSPDGLEPITHWGCNWVNCPHAVADALAALAGCVVATEWAAARDSAGLQALRPAPD